MTSPFPFAGLYVRFSANSVTRPMTTHTMKNRSPRRWRPHVGLVGLLLAAGLCAQSTTNPPAASGTNASAPSASGETVTLSPFEVRPDEDTGYQAMNTTAGSRLSTSLKDTAASISPFTAEFLSDIAATNVNEMLNYAANAEMNAGDSEGSGFNNPRDFSSAGGEPFRIRGIPGGVS